MPNLCMTYVKKKPIMVSLPQETYDLITVTAKNLDIPRSALVRMIVQQAVNGGVGNIRIELGNGKEGNKSPQISHLAKNEV